MIYGAMESVGRYRSGITRMLGAHKRRLLLLRRPDALDHCSLAFYSFAECLGGNPSHSRHHTCRRGLTLGQLMGRSQRALIRCTTIFAP